MDDSRKFGIIYKIAPMIDLALHAFNRIEVTGLDNYTRSPSTLVVMNHRRDTDVPIVFGTLLLRHRLTAKNIMPYAVSREDLFYKGFLKEHLENWPRAVREILSLIDLKSLLLAWGGCPIRRIRERCLQEVLQDVLNIFDDQPLSDVLKPTWVQRFENVTPLSKQKTLTIRKVLIERYRPLLRQCYGLRKLTPHFFKLMMPHERRVIESQLDYILDVLERGDSVFLAPEGRTSLDGSFDDRFKAGLHILINHPRTESPVLPVGITYDFMTTERQSVFLNFGQELTNLKGLPRKELDMKVAKTIRSQLTVTASQLASQSLLCFHSQGSRFTAADLVDHVGIEAQCYAESGAHVDPRLLTHGDLAKRVRQYLTYCLRSGMLVKSSHGRYDLHSGMEKRFIHESIGVMDYISNELASHARLRPEVAKGLSA